jgi:hypothetical protein
MCTGVPPLAGSGVDSPSSVVFAETKLAITSSRRALSETSQRGELKKDELDRGMVASGLS